MCAVLYSRVWIPRYVIWGSAAITPLDRLDHVQHKFLIWLESHVYTPYSSPSYSDLLTLPPWLSEEA